MLTKIIKEIEVLSADKKQKETMGTNTNELVEKIKILYEKIINIGESN